MSDNNDVFGVEPRQDGWCVEMGFVIVIVTVAKYQDGLAHKYHVWTVRTDGTRVRYSTRSMAFERAIANARMVAGM